MRDVALAMYADGADVIFHAAETSGLGLFDAATDYSTAEGRQVWAIGVDSDQYWTVTQLPGATDATAWQTHILTSVLKGIPAQTYELVAQHARGEFTPGDWNWGLASGASDISYSGGYLDDIRAEIEEFKAQIIAGEIDVPCIPEDRLDAAAELGIGPDDCHN
jgi:basic membrane protein A